MPHPKAYSEKDLDIAETLATLDRELVSEYAIRRPSKMEEEASPKKGMIEVRHHI